MRKNDYALAEKSDPSQDGPDMLIYRGPDGQRLNRAQFASWLQGTKVELGYASDAD